MTKPTGKQKQSLQHSGYAQQLREHCQQAWTFIKKHPGKKWWGISPRPWILLLGTPHAGKTSLLCSTTLSLNSPHNTSLDTVTPTKLVDWWVNENVVFIDPASEVALPTNDIETTRWQTLLEVIRSYRMMRTLHHVILTIDLPALLANDKATLSQLSTQLQSVQQLTKTIPVSVVITQCDQLTGFNEMFDDLSADQRQQNFGIYFSNKDRANGLAVAFKTAFADLIIHLKSRLLNRLHHEQSLQKRQRIFAFPAKLAALSDALTTLITDLPFNSTIPLQAIHFTAVTTHRNYFSEAAIQSAIDTAKQQPKIKKYAGERLLAFPIAAGIIFGFTLLWHIGYDQTITIIDKTQTVLASTPTNIPKDMPWLSKLNTLSDVLQTIHHEQTINYQWIGLLQTQQIHQAAKEEYDALLQTQFIPYIKATLLTQIQLGMQRNKLALFDALKTYISISEQQYYNKDIIMNWYRTYWKARYPNDIKLQATLQRHLFVLLESNQSLWLPDISLIRQAQAILQKLPLADLAFLELQGEYEPVNVSIFPNGKLTGISLKNATVPSFFSTTHFKAIFNNKIPNINQTLAKGNWVLGTTTGKVISAQQQADITKKVQQMYLQYYTNVWADTVTAIQLQPAKNYAEVLQRINNVLDEHSGLSQLLKVVVGNASLNGGATNKNLIAVKALLDKKGRYQNIQAVLTALNNEIQTIQKSKNPTKTSYLATVNRFKQNGIGDPIGQMFAEAKQNPQPIKSWLNTIARSSWKVMLTQSRSYLNDVWQTIVLPVYHNEIENRYPIFANSRENISLKNFNDFFGPNGAIGAYFIYYLQPFVNMTKNYWTWKSLNGESLNIPQTVLNSFIRASIIQQMFFTDDHNKPSFRFVLSPLTVSGNTEKFTLNVGGQIYTITATSRQNKQFYWPGPDPSFVSIQFITADGKNIAKMYSGPWSWFRMLSANTLQTTGDPRQFTLTIQSGSHSVSFKAIADHRVNPMVPGVMSKYRCPERF